jgi:hypothetical protein
MFLKKDLSEHFVRATGYCASTSTLPQISAVKRSGDSRPSQARILNQQLYGHIPERWSLDSALKGESRRRLMLLSA